MSEPGRRRGLTPLILCILAFAVVSSLSLYTGMWIASRSFQVHIQELRLELLSSVESQQSIRKDDVSRLADLTIRYNALEKFLADKLVRIHDNTEVIRAKLEAPSKGTP